MKKRKIYLECNRCGSAAIKQTENGFGCTRCGIEKKSAASFRPGSGRWYPDDRGRIHGMILRTSTSVAKS